MKYYLTLNNKDSDSLDKYIREQCLKNELDIELFERELSSKLSAIDRSTVRSPYWFIRTIIDNTIKEHGREFKLHLPDKPKIGVRGDYIELFKDLREKGFKEERYEHYLISLIEDSMLVKHSAEEINALNHRAIGHCVMNNTLTFGDFIAFISQGLDISELKEKAIKDLKELEML